MDIGEQERVIVVEPLEVPLPDEIEPDQVEPEEVEPERDGAPAEGPNPTTEG